jgi:hypothetical protein
MTKGKVAVLYSCAILVPVFFYVWIVVCHWYPVTDGSPDEDVQALLWAPMIPFMLLLFLSVAAVVFVLVSLIISLFIKRLCCRRMQIFCALFAVTFVLGWFASGIITWRIRRAAFERVTQRGEPIIQAIESYRSREGGVPSSLNDLVPKHIKEIPGTGIRAYPEFEYEVPLVRDEYYKELYEKHKALYELRVDCSLGGLNWDCCIYWPSEDYPESIYGGRTERIGKWAYVHE